MAVSIHDVLVRQDTVGNHKVTQKVVKLAHIRQSLAECTKLPKRVRQVELAYQRLGRVRVLCLRDHTASVQRGHRSCRKYREPIGSIGRSTQHRIMFSAHSAPILRWWNMAATRVLIAGRPMSVLPRSAIN